MRASGRLRLTSASVQPRRAWRDCWATIASGRACSTAGRAPVAGCGRFSGRRRAGAAFTHRSLSKTARASRARFSWRRPRREPLGDARDHLDDASRVLLAHDGERRASATSPRIPASFRQKCETPRSSRRSGFRLPAGRPSWRDSKMAPHDPLRTNRSPSLSLATSTGIAPSIFIGPSANQRVVRVVPGRLFAFAPSSLEWVPTRSLLLCPTVLTKGSKHSAHRPLSGSSEGALDVADGDEPRQRFDSGHADTSIFHCLSQRRSSEAPMPWEPGQGESARHHP